MNSLDNHSLATAGMLLALTLTIVSLVIWRTRQTYPGFGRWTAGNFIIALALLFFSLAGTVPRWISMDLANLATIAASIIIPEGIREFRGRKPHIPILYFGGAVAAIIIPVSIYVTGNVAARVIILSSFVVLSSSISASMLLRRLPPAYWTSMAFTGVVFAINASAHGLRAIYFLSHPVPRTLMTASPANSGLLIVQSLVLLGWTAGMYLMTYERMVTDLIESQDRATRADSAKSEFLASMSHEIRTPMNGVLGMTALLLETELTEEQLDYVQTAHHSANALLTLINDILDLSKIEAGKMRIDSIPLDLKELLDEVAGLLSLRAREKGLALSVSYPDDAPRRLVGDPSRIRQVVTNLAANALKFTDSGRVSIAATCAHADQDSAEIHLSVTDTGIGIPPENIGLVFEKFRQADASTTRKYGGTGLGLAISKQLVELMGGSINVESRVGQGSTFSCKLPMKPVRESVSAASSV